MIVAAVAGPVVAGTVMAMVAAPSPGGFCGQRYLEEDYNMMAIWTQFDKSSTYIGFHHFLLSKPREDKMGTCEDRPLPPGQRPS